MGADKLRELAENIGVLRSDIFCSDIDGLSPEAEQHLCMALDHLAIARSNLQLAAYRQMKKE